MNSTVKFCHDVIDLPFMGNIYFRPVGPLCCRLMIEDLDSLKDARRVLADNGYFIQEMGEFFPVTLIVRK